VLWGGQTKNLPKGGVCRVTAASTDNKGKLKDVLIRPRLKKGEKKRGNGARVVYYTSGLILTGKRNRVKPALYSQLGVLAFHSLQGSKIKG